MILEIFNQFCVQFLPEKFLIKNFIVLRYSLLHLVTGDPFVSIIEEQEIELKRLRALESAVKNIFHDDQIRKLTTGKRVVYR